MLTAKASSPTLPPAVARLVASIDSGQVLGASRQLSLLGDCLQGLADVHASEPAQLRADVTALVEHVERTRGGSSKAVTNGMTLMTAPLLASPDANGAVAAQHLDDAVEAFRADLTRWLQDVRRHASNVLSHASVLLAYDYSSTVAQVVGDLADSRGGLRVLVPEARSLDGGVKYLPDWQSLNVTIHLIPDSAIAWGLENCDAVVVGAETLSAEGGCYNTIGTASTAAAAARLDVPVYVLSVLLKTDLSADSEARPSPSLDFQQRLDGRLPTDETRATFRGDFPDLDYTPPKDIASVVTEAGVLAPAEVESNARRVLQPEDPS